MAQVKWSDDTAFPPGSALVGTEKFPGLDGAANKKWLASQIATYIIAQIVDSAPTALDTLNELAAALGDDPNFATTVTNALAGKLSLAGGTMTGDIGLGGTQRVIDSAAPTAPGHLTTKDYVDTVAALKATITGVAGNLVPDGDETRDLGSVAATWRMTRTHNLITGYQAVTGDANFTLTPLTSRHITHHTGAITANRTCTLSTTNAEAGMRFRLMRTGAGAFTISFGGLRSLATNEWAEAIYTGSAWVIFAYGTL